MAILADDLKQILSLYDRGLYVQAHNVGSNAGLYEQRDDAAQLILAGRLAGNLGAHQLGRICFNRAHRLAPTDPQARYFRARMLLERRGPWPAWQFIQSIGDIPEADLEIRSEWYALVGMIAGTFRDFDMAEFWFDRAEKTMPDNPWVWIERSWLLEQADRYEEAVAAARKSLEERPWYRAGVQSLANALTLVGRDEEAIELLSEALQHVESYAVAAQLFMLQMELRQWSDSWKTLERCETLAPLAEKEMRQWLSCARSDIAFELGNVEESVRYARESGSSYFSAIADHIERSPADSPRVSLPVGFVRQHHMTCAPATLSTLSRFWKRPAEHLEIAEEICYDGTPWHSERRWAEKNGWATREFRITWDSAVALLDRGIPFTLTTAAPGSAHLQAVVGYDARRGILEIRDPYSRGLGRALAEQLIEHHRATGPRGMAMVPREQAHLLEEIELPDAALYDRQTALQQSLEEHRRNAAVAELGSLEAMAPDHPLALQARRALASYDSDVSAALDVFDGLLLHFPTDASLRLARLSCLGELGRRAERLEYLETISEQVGAKPDDAEASKTYAMLQAAPVFWQQLAQELRADARQHDRAIDLLERALRQRPTDTGSLYILAGILWDRGKKNAAVTLFRFCACTEDKAEYLSTTYFSLARYQGQTDQALGLLKGRFKRLGGLSGQPARTLFNALNELGRGKEAFAVLEQALALRPNDGELQLFAVEMYARAGRGDEAESLLARAEGNTARPAWLRAAARLQTEKGNAPEALRIWREALEAEPLAVDAHRAAVRLIAQAEGNSAVNDHFARFASRFPHHFGLHHQWAEWLGDSDDYEVQEHVLLRMIEMNPAEAWTRRELAKNYAERRLMDRAFDEVEIAVKLNPAETASWSLQGLVMSRAGRKAEAQAAYRRAIQLSADNDYAIVRLEAECETLAERRDALQFVQREMVRQSIVGNGLVAFRHASQNVLPPDEVLAHLKTALTSRPDLWMAWSAAIEQLVDMGRGEEAARLSEKAVDRFPLVPRVWMDLAAARRACRNAAGERDALEKALQMAPGFTPARRELAEMFEREGQLAEARSQLEEACRRDPLDMQTRAALILILWKSGQRGEAIERVRQIVRSDPGAEWAWDSLREWCAEEGRGEVAESEARDVVRRRPNEPRSWLFLARMLSEPRDLEERLEALRHAIELNPRLVEAMDLRSQLLAGVGRFHEALSACQPGDGTPAPPRLEGRAAWVEAERGNLPEAIRRMRALLDREADNLWGWSQIANWYRETGEFQLYEFAARKIADLAPQAAMGHGLLADAKMRQGDRPAAKAALQRAMHLSPDYAYAASALLDMQLEDNDLAGAQQTVDRMLLTGTDGWAHANAIRVALRRADMHAGMERLRELCLLPGDLAETLQAVDELMQDAQWRRAADTEYGQVLDLPACQPEVGALWVASYLRRQDFSCERKVEQLLARGEIGARAAGEFAGGLATTGQADQLRKYVHLHRDVLRAHVSSWASITYAYAAMGDLAKVREWCADWDRRTGLRPWMLMNLVIAFREGGMSAEAARVSRHALQLEADNSTTRHALWLAVDAAITGDITGTQQFLQHAADESSPMYQFLQAIAVSVVETASAAPAGKAAAFDAAKKRLAEARTRWNPKQSRKLFTTLYAQAVARVAEQSGSALAGVWATQEKLRYR